MSYIALSYADLCLAALLVVLSGGVSIAFSLGLEKSLVAAAARMVAQLAAVGYVLKLVFEQSSPAWSALIALIMLVVAAHELTARQTDRLAGYGAYLLGGLTLLAVGSVSAIYVTAAVIGAEPWYTPQVLLPILGMILGNALSSGALALETLTQAVKSERQGIEARLAMGHARFEAFGGVLKRALAAATMPIINAMAVAGVVSLPGMMTGQILAGADPVEAAKYQIMIMFVLSGAASLAALATAIGGVYLLTDARTRLRLDRLAAPTTRQSAGDAVPARTG